MKITGKMYWYFDNCLKDRKARVILDGICAELQTSKVGLSQGGHESPLLWAIYCNDMKINKVEKTVFADDNALFTKPSGDDEESTKIAFNDLQESLNESNKWCCKWKLLLSPEKTEHIIFKSPNKRKYFKGKLKLSNKEIKPTETVKCRAQTAGA